MTDLDRLPRRIVRHEALAETPLPNGLDAERIAKYL